MATVIIALGSSLGNRLQYLRRAASFLKEHSETAVVFSSIYETEPVGASEGFYLNAVARIETKLEPGTLLRTMKSWETTQGRDPDAPRWTDREIDLDIIDYDGRYFERNDLVIPHPAYKNRLFVLEPLREIEPSWVDAPSGELILDMIDAAPKIDVSKTSLKW